MIMSLTTWVLIISIGTEVDYQMNIKHPQHFIEHFRSGQFSATTDHNINDNKSTQTQVEGYLRLYTDSFVSIIKEKLKYSTRLG